MIHPDRSWNGTYLPIGPSMEMKVDQRSRIAHTLALRIAIIVLIGTFGRPMAIAQNWRITTTSGQLIFLEFPIDLLRTSGRHGLGIHGAYRPALIKNGTIPGSGSYHLQNYWNFGLQGFTAGIFHRFALRDRYGLHVEQRLLFRRWSVDRIDTRYNGGEALIEGLRNEEQHVFILKILIGKDIAWHQKSGPSRVMEIFSGVSIRSKKIDREWIESDRLQNEEFWLPALHFGLRWGFGSKRN